MSSSGTLLSLAKPSCPLLTQLSKPGMPVNSTIGAAQVSLARLGNRSAITELANELSERSTTYKAYPKLVRVGNDDAVAILINYLRAHLSDPSPPWTDYQHDTRVYIVELLSERLSTGPIAQNDGFISNSPAEWVAWWDRNKARPVTLSISRDVRDPYLKCLARKVEWGFPDAIFDMVRTSDPQVIPVLKLLATWGNPKRRPFILKSLQGRAQVGLLQLGDPEELKAVKRELDLPGCASAIEELRQLGGPVAAKILIDALDSPNYLPQYRTEPGYQRLVLERDEAISNALSSLVSSPPNVKNPSGSKKVWTDWWSRNGGSAQFVRPPVQAHE